MHLSHRTSAFVTWTPSTWYACLAYHASSSYFLFLLLPLIFFCLFITLCLSYYLGLHSPPYNSSLAQSNPKKRTTVVQPFGPFSCRRLGKECERCCHMLSFLNNPPTKNIKCIEFSSYWSGFYNAAPKESERVSPSEQNQWIISSRVAICLFVS